LVNILPRYCQDNKKVGKTTTQPMLGMLVFAKFGGRGAPKVVDIGGVRQGVSELIQAVKL